MKGLENYRAAQFSDKTELNDKELQMKNKVKLVVALYVKIYLVVFTNMYNNQKNLEKSGLLPLLWGYLTIDNE